MTPRENLLRAVRFERPERIPTFFYVNEACWNHYPREMLREWIADHPLLFPDFQSAAGAAVPAYAPNQRADRPYVDDWGCVWETAVDGITGTVTGHPLESWDAWDEWTPPDPAVRSGFGPVDWEEIRAGFDRDRAEGRLPRGSLRHGHTFLLLCDLRGYENLIFDMADGDPRLGRLIERIEAFNLETVERFLKCGAEWIGYPEDLGMQRGPMLSPEHFRRYIRPSYERLMAPAREAGAVIHMHSDGDIRELADDLVEGGVEVINVQDLVNGIDWIAERFAGRICIDIDIDRQEITPRGTPEAVDALIREEVERLGSREGGLMMTYGLYPGVPPENVRAVMDAMERYAAHYS